MIKKSDSINNLSFRYNKKEYFLTYLSIALLNPTFAQYNVFHIVFTIIVFYYFVKKKLRFDKYFFGIILLLNFIAIAQAFAFGSFTLTSYFGVYLIYLMPYFIMRLLGDRYWKFYINIIFLLAIISLTFWILQNISDSFSRMLFNISKSFRLDPISNESIIIYNLEWRRPTDLLGLIKNAGFTAEGGLYSCVLIIALLLNTIFSKEIINKKNIIFIISLLSTNSTAGYAALGIYIVGTSFLFHRKSYKFILFPLSSILFYLAIIQLPFMLEKVSKYYYDELTVYQNNPNPSRFGRFLSARVDLDIIWENPFWGRGIHKDTRYITRLEKEVGYSNSYLGIIGLASRYGLILWSLYFFYFYKNIKKYIRIYNINRKYVFIFLLAIMAVAMGQDPFNLPPYLIFTYLGMYSVK